VARTNRVWPMTILAFQFKLVPFIMTD
jgi:hypothetical protein